MNPNPTGQRRPAASQPFEDCSRKDAEIAELIRPSSAKLSRFLSLSMRIASPHRNPAESCYGKKKFSVRNVQSQVKTEGEQKHAEEAEKYVGIG
ncbi:MAG: hypothetical protein ACKV0T_00520, partial [Planctomycetales bacterium]